MNWCTDTDGQKFYFHEAFIIKKDESLFKNGRPNRSLPVNNSSSSVYSIAQRLIRGNGEDNSVNIDSDTKRMSKQIQEVQDEISDTKEKKVLTADSGSFSGSMLTLKHRFGVRVDTKDDTNPLPFQKLHQCYPLRRIVLQAELVKPLILGSIHCIGAHGEISAGGEDEGGPFFFQLKGVPEALCVENVPIVQKLDDFWIAAAGCGVEHPELLGMFDKAARLGKNQNHLVTALGKSAVCGDGIGNAAVIIGNAVYEAGAAGCGQGAACLYDGVIVLMNLAFVKIARLSGQSVGGNHFVARGIGFNLGPVQRICTGGVGDGGINVIQTEQVTVLQKAFRSEVLFFVNVLGVEAEIAAALACQVGGSICASCGHAAHIIKRNRIVQKFIQNGGAVSTLHAAALHNKSNLGHACSPFLAASPAGARKPVLRCFSGVFIPCILDGVSRKRDGQIDATVPCFQMAGKLTVVRSGLHSCDELPGILWATYRTPSGTCGRSWSNPGSRIRRRCA